DPGDGARALSRVDAPAPRKPIFRGLAPRETPGGFAAVGGGSDGLTVGGLAAVGNRFAPPGGSRPPRPPRWRGDCPSRALAPRVRIKERFREGARAPGPPLHWRTAVDARSAR